MEDGNDGTDPTGARHPRRGEGGFQTLAEEKQMRFQYFIGSTDPERCEECGYVNLEPTVVHEGGVFSINGGPLLRIIKVEPPSKVLEVQRV